ATELVLGSFETSFLFHFIDDSVCQDILDLGFVLFLEKQANASARLEPIPFKAVIGFCHQFSMPSRPFQ
ncbi:MAG: hypothetical protein IKM86_01335, partial [Acidaminococcaceae bacterium]|nr:hypothetical protein [Acidaminococcaceae bacterium]